MGSFSEKRLEAGQVLAVGASHRRRPWPGRRCGRSRPVRRGCVASSWCRRTGAAARCTTSPSETGLRRCASPADGRGRVRRSRRCTPAAAQEAGDERHPAPDPQGRLRAPLDRVDVDVPVRGVGRVGGVRGHLVARAVDEYARSAIAAQSACLDVPYPAPLPRPVRLECRVRATSTQGLGQRSERGLVGPVEAAGSVLSHGDQTASRSTRRCWDTRRMSCRSWRRGRLALTSLGHHGRTNSRRQARR